jgi:hypothetical protein
MTIDQLKASVNRVEIPGKWFVVGSMGKGFYVQIGYEEKDIDSGAIETQHGRKWYVSSHATPSEVIQTCLKAALTSAEHQVREHFRVDGVLPYGPHMDIEALVELCKGGSHVEVRRVG